MATRSLDDRYRSKESLRSMRGITAEARRHLSDADWDYLWTGVGDEVTVGENVREFSRWRFQAPLFAGLRKPDTSVRFLDMDLSFPFLTAPFGNDRVFHPDGHLAVGRAAERVGVQQMVPVAASFSLEDVAAASSVAAMYQMTMVGDEEQVLEMIRRAKRAGYRYICATYSPIRYWRERLIEGAFVPRWSQSDVNFGPGKSDVSSLVELLEFEGPRWDWKTMARVAKQSELPIVYKGVQSADDARAAMKAGACALYVSNYGGRSLDPMPASLEVLPEVRRAVGAEVPIILDSGIRRGSHIAMAIALGANVVAAGRLIALGLAADGEHGVQRVLEVLKSEFWMTLGQLGCSSVEELGPSVLRPPRWDIGDGRSGEERAEAAAGPGGGEEDGA